jgi:hypothetical protein
MLTIPFTKRQSSTGGAISFVKAFKIVWAKQNLSAGESESSQGRFPATDAVIDLSAMESGA